MNNHIRYIARFTVETATPIAIGSGEKGLEVDRLIIRDANNLPYIPGTSLAGVVRNEIDSQKVLDKNLFNRLFGFQETPEERKNRLKELSPEERKNAEEGFEGQGSRLIFSPAKLLANDGKTVLEGLQNIDFSEGYYSHFSKLPERDHVRINSRGAADTKGHGKFDEQLVHKGTRFVFELELLGTEADQDIWQNLVQLFYQPFFRIGAGTRKGFGQLKVIKAKSKTFNLNQEADLKAYLKKSSSLNSNVSDWEKIAEKATESSNWETMTIQLKPKDYFLFGAGFGDEEVLMRPKTERYFDWRSGSPEFEKEKEHYLIPATSVKGAIAHRTAYHYNRLKGRNIQKPFLEKVSNLPKFDEQKAIEKMSLGFKIEELDMPSNAAEWKKLKEKVNKMSFEDFKRNSTDWRKFEDLTEEIKETAEDFFLPVGENNEAIRALFGYSKDEEDGARGNVIFSDIYLEKEKAQEKVFSHVAIDRFTGGGINGALYQEKVVKHSNFELEIHVNQQAFSTDDPHIKEALKEALKDLKTGQLQLGGNTNKGHGVFVSSSTIIK